MTQLLTLWNTLDPRRRFVAIAAAIGVFVAVLALARMATQPGMALLYAGLDGARAGEVIAALDQRTIPYEVRGDSIFVPATQRDETRMSLAAQGLPANSATGYELLDGLTGFGTTAQMFDAAYWRAKEGELARTIMAGSHVRFARVHIAQGGTQPFRRDRSLSASVTVTPAGAPLTPQQAQALRFLVASAVAGLEPDAVSVIDSAGGLVIGDPSGPAAQAGDRAEQLRRNVVRLLEARVGLGRAVVEVNVETVTDRETIVERLIDPSARAAVSSETEERNATSSESGGAGVTVASNLPDGDAAANNGQSQSREVLTRERTNWEVSQTSREIAREPGSVRRLTVAVLIDGIRSVDASGTPQWTPRPDEELTALRDLVASAVGYDEARGDVITLRSMPFETLASDEAGVAGPGLIAALGLDVMGLIRLAALAAVILFLALFVLRPALRPRTDSTPPAEALAAFATPAALAGPVLGGAALTGVVEDSAGSATVAGLVADEAAPAQDPVERMRALIAERQDETLEILRGWMEEPEENR